MLKRTYVRWDMKTTTLSDYSLQMENVNTYYDLFKTENPEGNLYEFKDWLWKLVIEKITSTDESET